MIKRALLLVALAVAVLAAVVGWRSATWPSTQPDPIDILPGQIASGAPERLAEAIRFPTVTWIDRAFDTEVFDGFLDWLAATYPLSHEQLTVERHGGHSLLMTWPGTEAQLDPVLLMAHYDVVPIEPGTEHEWTHPPFAGVIADGYVWGRGAYDDKAGVIGILEAVESLLTEGFRPRRTVLLVFGHDEEIGGLKGAAQIAAHLRERGVRLHWLLDEGGGILEHSPTLGGPVAGITTAEKGYLSLRLVARAPGGHSSNPPERTAVGLIAEAVDRIQNSPFQAKLQAPTTDMLDVLAGELGGGMGLVLANRWLFGGLIKRHMAGNPSMSTSLRTTIAPTMLAAGDKDNVLPQRAEAVINFRLLHGDTIESVEARVAALVDDPRISIEHYGDFNIDPGPVSPVNDPVYQELAATIRGVWPGIIVLPGLLSGATDSRHFTALTDRIYRFRALQTTTEELAGVHGTDERINAQAFVEGLQFYRALIVHQTGDGTALEER